MLRPTHITPELGDLLRRIDQLKAGTTSVQDMTLEQRERWVREYAACAALHGARLDQYTRTVSG